MIACDGTTTGLSGGDMVRLDYTAEAHGWRLA